ncbi:hypothetical protein DYB37_002216 [Aphanomyces astaci]|nr:hypothetical protein DYB36_000388 [Aphanomyces astaci]RHY19513.1 hypothetical protein DYB25_005620 [Aphanomyces astaci]RHY46066.1 hypothetical protein DYB34_009484 [Aphanomyces astaci]RHY48144.1 hypothetical protein DYB38_007843 [Aphanomyces astaci]RHY57791.1 hypothetical protein DYB30_010462 [Aphanomyces astaci]
MYHAPLSPGQTSTASSDSSGAASQRGFSRMLHGSDAVPSCHVSPELKCQYKTGTCTNERTTKKNGKLLMLCELHRKKQNEIKKRSDRKQSAMRMNRRLEAKQKAMVDPRQDKAKSFKQRVPKFEELLSCDPSHMWDHHSHHQYYHDSSAVTLPRVNVWRTKDGIATSIPGLPPRAFAFPTPYSPSGHLFDWSVGPQQLATGNVTPRGNDLAILEFFLDD